MAHDGNSLAYLLNFIQLVRNKDDGKTSFPQLV